MKTTIHSIITLSLFTLAGSAGARPAGKPNVILILADDLGYADVGCFGSERFDTPHIDALAANGIRFTDFHSNGAVCSPTRAALLTGRYQQRSGITGVVTAKSHRHTGLALEEVTFAEAMKEAGYVTGMFGKWHVGYDPKFNPVHQGFDEFRGYVSGNVDYQAHIDQEGYEDWWNQDKLEPDEGYSTDLITQYGVDFIRRHKDAPFLLYLPHEAPHYPFQGRKDTQQYQPGAGKGIHGAKRLDADGTRRAYKEMIEVMDEGIGRIVAEVKAAGLEKDTLIIFFSDNGPSKLGSAGPLRGGKGSIYEGGHRVPAVAYWPGVITPGSESATPVAGTDIFPTLIAIADAERPDQLKLDGVNLLPILQGGELSAPRSLYWGIKNQIAVREGPWKLVASKQGKTLQLFNLHNDLGEKNNVAGKHPEKTKALLKKLQAWDAEVSKNVPRRT